MPTERHDWLAFCFGHLERHQEPVKDEDRPRVGAFDEIAESFTCGQRFLAAVSYWPVCLLEY